MPSGPAQHAESAARKTGTRERHVDRDRRHVDDRSADCAGESIAARRVGQSLVENAAMNRGAQSIPTGSADTSQVGRKRKRREEREKREKRERGREREEEREREREKKREKRERERERRRREKKRKLMRRGKTEEVDDV